MKARFRLAPSPRCLFSAPPLWTREIERIPTKGTQFEDESGSYTVVRVLNGVPPDEGQFWTGPIVFVVRALGTK